jgi:hypothetical protein
MAFYAIDKIQFQDLMAILKYKDNCRSLVFETEAQNNTNLSKMSTS